jgi:hypothetical protein
MGQGAKQTRENRTITVDFQNEVTYFPHSTALRGGAFHLLIESHPR